MLLVTAVFNFILSKKANSKPSKRQQEVSHGDQSPTTVCVADRASSTENNFSFLHLGIGGRGGGMTPTPVARLSLGERGESREAMLKPEQTAAPRVGDRERRRWRERTRRLMFFRPPEEPAGREMEEMECYSEPDTTSDTAPMITDWGGAGNHTKESSACNQLPLAGAADLSNTGKTMEILRVLYFKIECISIVLQLWSHCWIKKKAVTVSLK